jgi:hypothetical protein
MRELREGAWQLKAQVAELYFEVGQQSEQAAEPSGAQGSAIRSIAAPPLGDLQPELSSAESTARRVD